MGNSGCCGGGQKQEQCCPPQQSQQQPQFIFAQVVQAQAPPPRPKAYQVTVSECTPSC